MCCLCLHTVDNITLWRVLTFRGVRLGEHIGEYREQVIGAAVTHETHSNGSVEAFVPSLDDDSTRPFARGAG